MARNWREFAKVMADEDVDDIDMGGEEEPLFADDLDDLPPLPPPMPSLSQLNSSQRAVGTSVSIDCTVYSIYGVSYCVCPA